MVPEWSRGPSSSGVSSSLPSPRFMPPVSQLPQPRRSGVAVTTVLGREGPAIFGLPRPGSARTAGADGQPLPPGSRHTSIEGATRWGGMFERLHASYLDPSGVWRVLSHTGPTTRVDLQPFLDGAQAAADNADAASKAAQQAMRPAGAAPSSSAGSRLPPVGRGQDHSRRPVSAGPVSAGPAPPLTIPHQRADTSGPFTVLKHNVYQQQPEQPAGAFHVRVITATPQKGICLRAGSPDRPNGPHDLQPGEGQPQVSPCMFSSAFGIPFSCATGWLAAVAVRQHSNGWATIQQSMAGRPLIVRPLCARAPCRTPPRHSHP